MAAGATASNDGDVSGNHGGYDAWLVKLDAAGNPLPNSNNVTNAFSPVQVSNSSPQQENTFQDTNFLNTLNKTNTQVSKDLTTQATTDLAKIKSLPDAASKKAYLLNIAKTNPDEAKKIIELAKKPTGLTATEKKLLGSSAATRAQFIANQFTGMTKDQKIQILKDYAGKKIVTKAVVDALAKLLNGQ